MESADQFFYHPSPPRLTLLALPRYLRPPLSRDVYRAYRTLAGRTVLYRIVSVQVLSLALSAVLMSADRGLFDRIFVGAFRSFGGIAGGIVAAFPVAFWPVIGSIVLTLVWGVLAANLAAVLAAYCWA